MNDFVLPLARLCVGLGLLMAGVAQAQLANNLTIGNPKAMALANAVTADSTGVDAVHYNPAALTKLKGRQTTVKFLTGVMDIRAEFDAPQGYNHFGFSDDDVKNSSSRTLTPAMYLPGLGGMTEVPMLFAPLAGLSINPPGSKLTFATNVYAPMALGYSRDDDSDPARYQGREVALQRITYFSPSLGYQMNDELALGLSIGFSHQAMALNQDFRNPSMLTGLVRALTNATCVGNTPVLAPFIDLCGGNFGPFTNLANLDLDLQQSLSPTFNLGVQWEPTDWFAWGATYQSEARMKLTGKYRVDYTSDWTGFWKDFNQSFAGQIGNLIFGIPQGTQDEETGNASLTLTYPDSFATGIKVRPFERWQFNADVRWVDYSDWDQFEIKFDRELDMLRIAQMFSPNNATSSSLILDRGYEDTISWALGVQYDLNERVQLRAGYEWRPSAIPKDKADVLAPIGDAHLYGLGVGYRWDKDTQIDLGFNYFVTKTSVPADTSCNLNCTGLDNVVYNPYAGLDVETSVHAYVMALTYQTVF